jgi:hypothetical protein
LLLLLLLLLFLFGQLRTQATFLPGLVISRRMGTQTQIETRESLK